MINVPVLIAGGGPVGLTLAICLSFRGVRCMLVERNGTTTTHPKMDRTNSRTMELFRVLGIADTLRQVAVPQDHPGDVSWITSMAGQELCRFRYPSVIEMRERIRAVNDGTQPLEPTMRVSQVEIEPVLKARAEQSPLADVRFGTALEDLEQDATGVTAVIRSSDGSTESVRCQFLAGCDGGNSTVRTRLDISMSGKWRIMPRYMVHFRSDARDILERWGRAWHHQSNRGTLISQNGHDIWTLHARFPDGVAPDEVNPSALIEGFAGCSFPHEILVANAWSPHLVVADSYRAGRVFLAGDAAHQYIPTGGYGMNTGVGDAFDLGWKLAAVVQGIGGSRLLDSYEAERRPIGQRNCEASQRHNDIRVAIAKLYGPLLHDKNTEDPQALDAVRDGIIALGDAENASNGIEYGYSYGTSPVICHEPGAILPDDPVIYRPTTIPGARLPSVFLDDGAALFDLLGPWFTLIVLEDGPAEVMMEAAARLSLPVKLLPVRDSTAAAVYRTPALLVRPDHHIAWRGALPLTFDEASSILSCIFGRDV